MWLLQERVKVRETRRFGYIIGEEMCNKEKKSDNLQSAGYFWSIQTGMGAKD